MNRTDPALMTSAPLRVRHPISSFGTSLMISASHSTVCRAGAFATQCERRASI
jgi:hypothetical protein